MNNIDYDSLRNDLIDYLGTGAQHYPAMYIELSNIETCSYYELINYAIQYGFNIDDYIINDYRR